MGAGGGPTGRGFIRRVALGGATLVAGLFAFLVTPQPVAAEIFPPGACSATIQGQPATRPFVSDFAIHVKEHTAVTVSMHMDSPVHRRIIYVGFGIGPYLPVSDETDPSSETTQVSVDKYATYGVGLYAIHAVANSASGVTCNVYQHVYVEGNPLTTVAGGAAAGLEVLSLLGIGGAAIAGANPGDAGTGVKDPQDDPYDPSGFPKDPLAAGTPEQFIDRADAMASFGFCAMAAIPALLLTTAAMVGGATPSGAPIQLRRVRWRPKFSIVGMGSGVVGGLAAVVLLQETGKLFPSYEILGRALVAGLLVGILVPSLTRLIAVRRANRRVRARELAINRAVAQRQTAGTAAAWVATHRAGAAGAPARAEPDAATASTFTYGAGTALRLVEERAAWARVQSVDGREGWVEVVAIERMV